MPTRTRGSDEVGYCKPPRGAGFKKGQSGNPRGRPPGSKSLTNPAERHAERAGDNHRERSAPQDQQARGGDQAARQQIGVCRSTFPQDPARPDAEPRGAGALFHRSAPAVGPGDEEVLVQLKTRLEGAIRDSIAAGK